MINNDKNKRKVLFLYKIVLHIAILNGIHESFSVKTEQKLSRKIKEASIKIKKVLKFLLIYCIAFLNHYKLYKKNFKLANIFNAELVQ